MDHPKSAADNFFGLDLQTGDSRLGGMLVDCTGGPITPEIIDEAYQRIVNAPPPIPCGYEGNPHLVRPRPAGKITYCIQCGHMSVLTEGGKYRDLNEQEQQEMYEAFKSLMDKGRRRGKRKPRSL